VKLFFHGRSQRNERTRRPPSGARLSSCGKVAEITAGWHATTEFLLPAGFSLLELMASVAILLIITAATFSLLSFYQKTYATTQLQADLFQNLRGVTELMAQEVGQAGLVSLPASQLSAAVTADGAPQTVLVSSTTSMFVGEKLLTDTASSQELITLTGVNTVASQITAIFGNNHATGAPLNVAGVFSNGLMTSSTSNLMQIFGDINADGSLVYIHYNCNPLAGTLTRSITTVTPTVTVSSPSQILLNTVTSSGTANCFQYTSVTSGAFTFITNVTVTLSIRSLTPDPVTHNYLTMTKSFSNLTPRNMLAGLELAKAQFTDRLQPTPPNLPLP
jgi:prepilin-type N-terminal cleavage/methylation domain-containing protein